MKLLQGKSAACAFSWSFGIRLLYLRKYLLLRELQLANIISFPEICMSQIRQLPQFIDAQSGLDASGDVGFIS